MLPITPDITIPESEIQIEFTRASGPGGQNVNKVSTAVQLRFDLAHSPSLPEDVRQRAMALAGNRLTNDGLLIIDARQHRTQEQNRQAAYNRLTDLLRRAVVPPKPRKKTRPSAAARQRRLEAKLHHSEKKRLRRWEPGE